MIERVPLDSPPQVVAMSLAHNHPRNLFILSYSKLPLANLSSKSNSMVEDDRTLLYWW